MPVAVTIDTACGQLGLVHADVSLLDGTIPTAMLEAGAPDHVDIALLGPDAPEDEVRRHRSRPVAGLRALVHGHFVVDEVEHLANRWNIDTGATYPGRDRLTLLHVNARCQGRRETRPKGGAKHCHRGLRGEMVRGVGMRPGAVSAGNEGRA